MWLATKAELLYWWPVGWFWRRKNATLSMLCQIVVCGIPIPKFHVFMLPLSLVAGPQKIWTVTLHKMSTPENCILNFLRFYLNQNILFSLFKGKKWSDTYKTVLPIFGRKQKIHNKLQFQILFLVIVLWFIRKDSVNFQIIYIFKVLAIFWKLKLCRACNASAGRHLLIFWNWPPKIYLISRNV